MSSYTVKRPAAAAAAKPGVAKKAKKSSASAFQEDSDEDWAPPPQSSEDSDEDWAPPPQSSEDVDEWEDKSDEEGTGDDFEAELDPDSDELPPVASPNLEVNDQIQRVLACLGADSLGTDLPFSEVLFKISALNDDHQAALADFRDNCRQWKVDGRLGQSLEPTDAFLKREGAGWASHDRDIDDLWEDFVEDVVKLGSGAIERESLVKPSGPLRAALTCFWHYPTFRTGHAKFGHVFDKTNPSLLFQEEKMGANGWVRTQNRIPIRQNFVRGGVPWSEKFPNWEKIQERCENFNKELLKYSKIMIFVGEENCETWRSFVNLAEGERITQVQFRSSVDGQAIKLPQHIYNQRPVFYTIRDRFGVVTKVVFLAYHSQYFIHSVESGRGAYTDLIWNAALSLAELDIVRYDAFVKYTGRKSMADTMTAAKEPQEQDDLSYMCYFVDPETNEACDHVRRDLGGLLRHWKAKHASSGIIWDYHFVTRVPHKPDLSKIQTVDSAKRSGRKPQSFDKPHLGCYYVDPDTDEPCTVTRTQLGVLKAHFQEKHEGVPWKPSKVKNVKQDMAQWEANVKQEAMTAKETSIKANRRARDARHKAKSAAAFKLQCLLCAYSNKMKTSNMKEHFKKKHPTVEWVKGGEGCYKKVALESEDA